MKEIHYKMDANGKLEYEVKGFTGKACKEVQESMARIGNVSDMVSTAEMHKMQKKPQHNELFRG